MKTGITLDLEKSIRQLTAKIGVYGCFEVTIGVGGKERVDYMTYDTSGMRRCYEIKASKADFYSKAKKSFIGNYNYYVMPLSVYKSVHEDIPEGIGVYIGSNNVKRARKQSLEVSEEILKDSMIRSLYRDSNKLYLTENEHYIDRLKREAERSKRDVSRMSNNYYELRNAVEDKFGRQVARELCDLS